jgi:hypothetical protein
LTDPVARHRRKATRRRWTGVIALVILRCSVVTLAVVAVVDTHQGRVPAWDAWMLFSIFWGTVLALVVRRRNTGKRAPLEKVPPESI